MIVLSPADRVIKLEYLAQAEKAYHLALIGGGAREFTDQNGEKIVYGPANRGSLLAYINQLRGELGLCYSGGPVLPPAGVIL